MEDNAPSDIVVLTSLQGHKGVFMHSSCVPYYKSLVLLQNLRDLFFKTDQGASSMVESDYPISIEKLKENCPGFHKNIFGKHDSPLNIQLLKTEYPKYYNYINTFSPTQTNYWEFEEIYYEVIKLINKNINSLVLSSKMVNEKSNRKSETSKLKSEKSFVKILDSKFILCINWASSEDKLKKLFKELQDNNYIKNLNEEILLKRFYITTQNSKEIKKNNKMHEGSLDKIHWTGTLPELAILFAYLHKKFLVNVKKRNPKTRKENYNSVLITNHYCNADGKPISNHSLGSAFSKIKRFGIKDKYADILNTIKNGLKTYT